MRGIQREILAQVKSGLVRELIFGLTTVICSELDRKRRSTLTKTGSKETRIRTQEELEQ